MNSNTTRIARGLAVVGNSKYSNENKKSVSLTSSVFTSQSIIPTDIRYH